MKDLTANPKAKDVTVALRRDLTRALNICTKQQDPYGLALLPAVFEFVPDLGHRVGTYLEALRSGEHVIDATWDALMSRAHVFNAWQRIWLTYLGRQANLFTDQIRLDWAKTQRSDPDPLLRAEATLAVAPHSRCLTFDDIDFAVLNETGSVTILVRAAGCEGDPGRKPEPP